MPRFFSPPAAMQADLLPALFSSPVRSRLASLPCSIASDEPDRKVRCNELRRDRLSSARRGEFHRPFFPLPLRGCRALKNPRQKRFKRQLACLDYPDPHRRAPILGFGLSTLDPFNRRAQLGELLLNTLVTPIQVI